MASTSDIRKGLCIKYNNGIYKIIEFLHVKPGKGPAFVRTKLKSVTNGKVIDNTFSAGHKIEDVRVETNKFQFLYNEGEAYHFMNNDDYNQISIEKSILDNPELMKEGEIVTISINTEDGMPLSVDMPASVILEVTHTEPGVKGNTATNATKPATVETGYELNVPLFINEDDSKLKNEELNLLTNQWNSFSKKIIICGLNYKNEKLNSLLNKLSNDEQTVILTESTSNLFGENFIQCIDRTLERINGNPDFNPELIISLGGAIISKKIKTLFKTL